MSITVSQCGTPSQRTRSQTRSQTKTRLQWTHRRHAHGWRSAPEAILLGHRRTHWWFPARTPTVHQCPHSGEAVGGPQHAPRDSTTSTRPRLSRHALVTNKLYHKIQKRSPSFFAVSQIHYSFIFLLLKSRMLIVLTISALQHLSQEDPHWTSKIFQDIKPAEGKDH